MRPVRSEASRPRRLIAALGALCAGFLGSATDGAAQASGPLRSAAGPADALQAPSSECCVMLLYPIGARRVGLGQSTTAVKSADAVFYNPAGLADLPHDVLLLHHVANEAQQVDAFSLVVEPFGLATFGLSYQLIDFGDEEATNSEGIPIGRITIRDHVLIASFATSVVAGLSAGMNYKLYNARWTCSGNCGGFEVNAITHGLDVGFQYAPEGISNLRLGAALLNAGFPLQVVNRRQADPMPTRLRVGVGYDVMQLMEASSPYELWVTLDAEDDEWKSPTTPTGSVGVELLVDETISLRAGYGGGEGVRSGPAVGVGLAYSSLQLDLAKRIGGAQSLFGEDPFQITLAVQF